MKNTGSGIVLAGYVDHTAGIIICRACADASGDSATMETIYTPEIDDDTPPCFSCGGVGYGMRPCETCAAPLVYPDEQHGATCVACEDN